MAAWASATWVATRSMPWCNSVRMRSSSVRMVPSRVAVSGITLSVVPLSILPTVMTADSCGGVLRLTRVCSASTISAAIGTGSMVSCGMAPWPPLPVILISNSSAEASSGPVRLANTPAGMLGEMCSANAASGLGLSSRPSASMYFAPCQPSSPGWNMKTTVPFSLSRWAHRARAAPASMATWVSWPQACIAPSTCEQNSSPVSSRSGSASMSPRSRTVRPFCGPRRMATRPLVEGPSRSSSGSPSSARLILAVVFGQSSPSSGSAWMARRSATASSSSASPVVVQSSRSITSAFISGPSTGR